jgi:hypothetical protein
MLSSMAEARTLTHPPHRAPAFILSGLGALAAALLHPWIFERLFALQAVDADFSTLLARGAWLVAGGAVLTALVGFLRRGAGLVALYLALLLLLAGELGFRGWLRHLAPPDFARERMARVPGPAAGFDAATADHPFVHYTGMPFSTDGRYNNFGFLGPDWRYERPPGQLRVALLGGSTTEWGLGDTLPSALAKLRPDSPELEVLNFGLSGWTSAHSATNFLLTVQDFEPDVVVIHHAWNDSGMGMGECPRGDYAGKLNTHPQVFRPVPGALLLRASALVRLAAAQARLVDGQDAMGETEHSPHSWLNTHGPPPGRDCGGDLYELRGEQWPLERNLRSIVAIAEARGIQPVILTMPRTDDPTKDRVTPELVSQIDAGNEANRRVAADSSALLVDAAAQMNHRPELFGDLAHVSPEGNAEKDRMVAEALAGWLDRCATGAATPCPAWMRPPQPTSEGAEPREP